MHSFYISSFFVLLLDFIKCDVFLSFADLEKTLHTEKIVALNLLEYIESEKLRLGELQTIANNMLTHSEDAIQKEPVTYLGNPINSFLLVKELRNSRTEAEEKLQKDSSDIFFLKSESSLKKLPDNSDVFGSAKAILRLQDTYGLSATTLADGKLPGVEDAPPLSAEQCFDIGQSAYLRYDYFHSTLWMEEAKDRNAQELNPSMQWHVLLDYLSFSVFKQGDAAYALNLTNQWLEHEPNSMRAIRNKEGYIKILMETNQYADEDSISMERNDTVYKRHLDAWESTKDYGDYEKLCRGEVTHPNPHAKDMKCHYAYPHEYFFLRPLKAEPMHHNPEIYMFHDVLTDADMEEIKRVAYPKLARSGVFTLVGQEDEEDRVSENRVSKTAWLNDFESDVIAKVSSKISKMTKLSLDSAEALQVLNYGIGGHYTPHWDFVRPEEVMMFSEDEGNRIATVFFYMSNLVGGATVFPRLGVRLQPIKGSVALWYNLLENGEGDYNTLHAACPVLTGTKWACNKWVHARGQEFIRPCSLDSFR